jgi:dTDP-glucose 4,6-dehydratase
MYNREAFGVQDRSCGRSYGKSIRDSCVDACASAAFTHPELRGEAKSAPILRERGVFAGGLRSSCPEQAGFVRIFVTGAEGFIGSHLVEALLERGHQVTSLVQYNSFGNTGWLKAGLLEGGKGSSIVFGDVRDAEFLASSMENQDVVLHLAALIAIPYSFHAPRSYIETNATGTLNILEAARRSGVSRVVHTSTSEVYGSAQYVPIDERHPVVGQSPYSASKISADQIAHSYWASFGLPVTTVRPFNTYGPRQSQRAFIPSVIIQQLAGVTKLALGSLHPTRDLTFVQDTVAGFVAVAEASGGLGEVFNMGSGFEVSMREVLSIISEVSGTVLQAEEDTARVRPAAAEVERLWSDSSKIKDVFGWESAHKGPEGLRLGLEKTYRWFQDNQNLPGYRAEKYVV